MRSRLILPIAVLLILTSVGAGGLAAQEATPAGPDALVFVEHNDLVQTIDLGDPGDSVGDILVWGPNPLYHASNETDTGAIMAGECITLPGDGYQHCAMTFVLPDGSQLTAQGLQRGHETSVSVITGGTGNYLGATGRLTSEPSFDLSLYTHTIEFGV